MSLKDARILVVGGGSGIGFAVASACASEGAKVTIASTNPEKLASAAERLGGTETVVLDLTDEAMVSRYLELSGTFDHIASTAGDWGKARRGPFAEMDLDDARALFGVRFWGSAILAKHGAKCVSKGGSITLTAGTSAYKPQRGSVTATPSIRRNRAAATPSPSSAWRVASARPADSDQLLTRAPGR